MSRKVCMAGRRRRGRTLAERPFFDGIRLTPRDEADGPGFAQVVREARPRNAATPPSPPRTDACPTPADTTMTRDFDHAHHWS
ncbi:MULTISPECIES: hypothetical protein [Pseudoxanthomonas]|uniref:Uncharacterized protein n=1 Tax=Pseudoxanthomonas winnipegensis TaxID=2480810 RepID=A0AAW8GDN1_9GAMM|nr:MULTISPECIES: hypothetical protein [Pseudoxanthomonas]MDQ1120474.1 hypothetical protein [Pseudoxanthomonas winnipegensis]MDQ1133693.1 hypothetical protein [Pseudoxanthomonas winnipegensis]MDR6140066.1 hypothetical protein [Pseudoxanthomonas sp. SORGH_AS_0997]